MKLYTLIIWSSLLFVACTSESTQEPPGKIEKPNPDVVDGIHTPSGLKDDENLMIVIGNCTACHSADLIIQNRANREGWKNLITWMQETQKLWDLGENEPKILDYLEKHYSPSDSSLRRAPLVVEEWYELQ